MIALTVLFFYHYGKNKISEEIIAFLTDLKRTCDDANIEMMLTHAKEGAQAVDKWIEENGSISPGDPELTEAMRESTERGYVNEMNVVDENGIIIASTVDEYLGYDMHSGEQSAEFLCLLEGTEEYAQDITEISFDNSTSMCYTGAVLHNMKGFVQTGYTPENYAWLRKSLVAGFVGGSLIGKTGFLQQIEEDGEILTDNLKLHEGEKLSMSRTLQEISEDTNIRAENAFGKRSYVWAVKIDDFYVLEGMPVDEVFDSWKTAIAMLIPIYLIIFVIVFIALHRQISKNVVRGVYSLNASLNRISEGDLDEKADFRETIEFDELSDDVNQTVDRLKQLIKEAEERIDAELALAATIQVSFIPHEFPAFPDRDDFELFASMIPAKEVGGDFYDFFLIDEDHLAIVIADVSGKGIPAAMFMVMAKNKIHAGVMKYCTDVAGAMNAINKAIEEENEAELFVTVWLGVITLSTGHVDYVDAGHDFPALRRSRDDFRMMPDVHGMLVGMFDDSEYKAGSLELSYGDVLFLYTDGVTEAHDPKDELFGEERMLLALNRDKDAPLEEIDHNLRKAIEEFAQGRPQFDDMTTLCFRYKNRQKTEETETEGWFL